MMMNRTQKLVSALGAALLSLTGFAQERGLPILVDNFTTHMTFAENWVPLKDSAKKIKSSDSRLHFQKNAELSAKQDTPLEFHASMSVSFPGNANHNSDAGYSVENGRLRFFVKPDGVTGILNGTEPVGTNVKISAVKPGGAFRLVLSRHNVEDGKVKYTFRVDGQDAGSLVTPVPTPQNDSAGKKHYRPLVIYSADAEISVEKFALYTIKDIHSSPNRIMNSSFEYDQGDGEPHMFLRNALPLKKIKSMKNLDDYLATWAFDREIKRSGKQSLRLINNELTENQWVAIPSGVIEEGLPGVFSLWMKSDREALPVTLNYANVRKQVKVGRDWTRFEIVNPKFPKKGLYPMLSMFFSEKGTLWVDDLQSEVLPEGTQAEEGKSYASAYRACDKDKDFFTQKQEVKFEPLQLQVQALPQDVKPTIDLDAWKSHALKIDKFYMNGRPATEKNPVEAYMACDAGNLYLGLRAFRSDLANVILSRNLFEAMIDTTGKGKRLDHYQFYLHGDGKTSAKGRARDSHWKGEWTGDVRKNETYKSIDFLMTIPLSDLAAEDLSPRWIMTLACYNEQSGYSGGVYISSPEGFLGPHTWPRIDLPGGIIAKHKIGSTAGTFTDSSVFVEIGNATGVPHKGTVTVGNLEKDGALIGEKTVDLAGENTIVEFPCADKPKKISVKITENGKTLSNLLHTTKKHTSINVLNRLSFYMNEPEAEFRITTKLPDLNSMKAVLTVAGKTVESPVSPRFKMKVPLSGVPDGEHAVKVSFRKDGREIAAGGTTLTKLPFRNGSTQINRFSRSLIHNGKPVVPFMPFLEIWWNKNVPHGTPEHIKAWFDVFNMAGIRSYMLLASEEERTGIFMDRALKNNATVLFWGGYGNMSPERKREYIKNTDYPNILWHVIMDEPELTTPSDKALEHLREMRQFLPKYYPVSANLTVLGVPSNYANLEMEPLMLDDYLTGGFHRTVESVIINADLLWKAGEAEGKPCAFFLSGSNTPLHAKEPSYDQQIAQSYGAVAAGCNALAYFYGMPKSRGNWNAYLQLNEELAALTEVLTSEEEISPAKSSVEKRFRLRTHKLGNHVYVITCNIDEEPAGNVTITLPGEVIGQ